jgi:MFS transporter, OFA family, oxalate/formate antiporter
VTRVVPRGERWGVLVAGALVMMTAGASYSWSLYTRPLEAFFGWSSFQVAFAFSLLLLFLGSGAIAGGFLNDRLGPRRVGFAGAALWGAGNLFTGLALARFGLPGLYAFYGAMAGFGCGMMYIVPGAAVTKWFPEERGLANGAILFGFGSGSLIFNLVAGRFPAFAHVADIATRIVLQRNAALAAGRPFTLPAHVQHVDIGVVSAVFVWSGVAFLIVGCLAALMLHEPPPGYAVPKAAAKLAHERDVPPREMLHMPSFALMWIVIFVNATCGSALFSVAVPIYAEATHAPTALAIVAFGYISATNGIGRLLWGWISDALGRIPSIAACLLLQAGGLFWIGHVHTTMSAVVAFSLAILCFGGIFGVAPAVMADLFGTRYLGEDYALLITAAGGAGLLGPLGVAALEDKLGSLTAWLLPAAVLLLVTTILPFFIRRPQQREA